MNSLPCGTVRDLLPEWMADSLHGGEAEELEAHLAGCPGCREELAVLETLLLARPEPPSGLEARIQAAVRQEMLRNALEARKPRVLPMVWRRDWIPAWALAAAVVLLALGARLILNPRGPDATLGPIMVAIQQPLPEAWLWDDGIVAGAPVFDGLSDEDLEALLQEWEG
jgi:anti-sigma factor RsiW